MKKFSDLITKTGAGLGLASLLALASCGNPENPGGVQPPGAPAADTPLTQEFPSADPDDSGRDSEPGEPSSLLGQGPGLEGTAEKVGFLSGTALDEPSEAFFEERAAIMASLADAGDEAVGEIVVALGHNETEEGDRVLLEALAIVETPDAIQAIAERLVGEEDPETRRDMAEQTFNALSGANAEALEMVTSIVAESDDPAIIGPAADALARLANPESVRFLAELHAEAGDDESQRENLNRVVAGIRNPEVIDALGELVTRPGELDLMEAAASSLAKIGEIESLEKLVEAASIESNLLIDREVAMKALTGISSREALTHAALLLETLEEDRGPVKEALRRALAAVPEGAVDLEIPEFEELPEEG